MGMYETRQNKEKVSRSIEVSNKVRQNKNNKIRHDYITKQKSLAINNITQNKLIQFVEFVNATFFSQKHSNWGPKQKQQVENAISKAKSQLAKAMSKTRDELIQYCIGEVTKAISDNSLTIYKLETQELLAQSTPYGTLEISLNIKEHKGNEYEISKTLIHECFHIKCGGLTGSAEYPYNKSKEDARREIECQQNSNNINPDSFAQFVMQC